jgi:hypothetical protein
MSVNSDKLAAPFAPKDVEWRIQNFGIVRDKPWAMVLAYVTNRAIQERLDEVVGYLDWKNEYSKSPEGGILCGISIWDGDKKEWVTKYDGADNTAVEAVKGGLSGSMKRAAVQWGIGRYLYKLEANFAEITATKPSDMTGWNQHYDKKTSTKYFWKTPQLPVWALPSNVPKSN